MLGVAVQGTDEGTARALGAYATSLEGQRVLGDTPLVVGGCRGNSAEFYVRLKHTDHVHCTGDPPSDAAALVQFLLEKTLLSCAPGCRWSRCVVSAQ